MNLINLLPIEKTRAQPVIHKGNYYYTEGVIPQEILKLIFENFKSEDLASCDLVCKEWHNLTNHQPINDCLWNKAIASEIHQYANFVFGKEEWNRYFGDCGNVPNYPREICKILSSNCPFFNGQTVGKTHMFVLVPKTVDGEPLTLNFLANLVIEPKEGNSTYFDRRHTEIKVFEMHGNTPNKKSKYVLLTNKIINETRIKSYHDQKNILNKHAHYKAPKVLDASLCVFISYLHAEKELLWSWTRCQEELRCEGEIENSQVMIGHFSRFGGLCIDNSPTNFNHIGVMACREL